MNIVLEVGRYFLPAIYAVALVFYLIFFIRKTTSASSLISKFSTTILATGVVGHFSYAVLRGIAYEHHPMSGLYEIQSLVALALASVYLVIERWRRNKSTGVFVLPFVLCIQIVSSINIKPTMDINPILKQVPFGAHTGFLTIAYAAFFLSTVYGVMFLLFRRALLNKSFGLIFERFPSLDVLTRMFRGAMLVGFVTMTIGVIFGLIQAIDHVPEFWADPKIAATLLSWLIFGFALLSHYKFGWPAKRVVILIIVGACSIVVSMIIFNIFVPSWHQFIR